MTQQAPICCMVIAPCSPEALEDAAFRLARKTKLISKRDFLRDTDWKTAHGTAHAALYTCEPGSEATDWGIAEVISPMLGDVAVYTVWFDIELAKICEWRHGKRVAELERDAVTFVRGLGFDLDFPEPRRWEPSGDTSRDVVIVEGASVGDLRTALGSERIAERELKLEPARIGAAVHRDGRQLVGEPGQLVGGLPERTVYHAKRDDEGFEVSVMRETPDYYGVFHHPPRDSDDSLPDILGARTPETILAALGVSPSLLGYGD